jgi:hypothetical protein
MSASINVIIEKDVAMALSTSQIRNGQRRSMSKTNGNV